MTMLAAGAVSCASSPGKGGAAAPPAASSASAGGGTPAPQQVAAGALGSLTATKWRLPNGLEIILMPDPDATSVSYMTWFRVGSRNENEAAGETGLAHLFEHLMFTQTRGAKEAGEFDRRMEEVGASVNAMTYYDFTAYVDNLPPSAVELAVRLEADRMTNLDLRPNQVENERDVVAEERLSTVEDSVDGTLDEIMWKQAFKTHPYRRPVIGWMKDIKALTDRKVLAFYSTFYAPNNAVVVAAGKLEPQATLGAIARAYGPLRSSQLPPDTAKPERAPAAEVVTAVSRPVPADRLAIGYPGVALGAGDRAAYDVLVEILLGGPSSRLYRLLVVDKEIASTARGEHAATRDPGLFTLWIQMKKGHRAAEAEALVGQEIARLAREPAAEPELAAARSRLEAGLWRGLTSSSGRSELLGTYEVSTGDFRNLFHRADELARVQAEDVRRIAAAYLAPGARSIAVATPK